MSPQPFGSFHVRHDLTPGAARDALLLLRQSPACDGDMLLERAREHDFGLGRLSSPDKVLASLRDLGLVERGGPRRGVSIELTPVGRRIADLASRDPLLFPEFVHLRYWHSWSEIDGGAAFGWAYRTLAGALYDAAPARIEPDQLTATVLATAEEHFSLRGISFSRSSVLGVLHWLRALSPPCIEGDRFIRRPAASPEAFLAALNAARGGVQRTSLLPLRLETTHRDQVCRSLLMDPAAFDDMIDRAEEGYGLVRFREAGTERVVLPEVERFPHIALLQTTR